MKSSFEQNVIIAEAEARRFLARVKLWREKADKERMFVGCQYSAAVKRGSMDLSRSLTEVRKGNR